MKTLPWIALGFALVLTLGVTDKGDAGPLTRDYRPVPKAMLEATVRIRVNIVAKPPEHEAITGAFSGSGVFIGPGKILTAGHLFDTSDIPYPCTITSIEVEMYGKYGQAWTEGKLAKADFELDLAIVEVEAEGPGRAVLDFTGSQEIGDPVFIIGGPAGLRASYATYGYLASKGNDDRIAEYPWWGSSNGSYPGNSGGPVFDAESGKLIGILVAGPRGAPNVSFFVPLVMARGFLA